ncbi:bromodomain-containing protein 4-like isoform X1 [Cydia fagiglandana]|uniref:bromodomain-containing protein 4-like isoform X1 n=1 Tax=Cydia fagiglandana TaxID=1458189 RepID=UPI002FEE51BC
MAMPKSKLLEYTLKVYICELNAEVRSRYIHAAKGCRVGTEETLIKFRPSPNFKNMKKFIKSKIDFTENSNHSPFHGTEHSPTNTSPEPIMSLEEQRALLEKAKPAQPPLPLEPPPTTPIDFSLPHKQEIEDQSRLGSPTLNLYETNEVSSLSSATNYDTSQVEASEKQKKTICRDFIRGTCSRAGTCKYAHERDLSQLPGVYTFCKNFQNTVCTYPYCKYVHASIFEEQRFYRTGILPPHALAHHKKPPPAPMPTVLPPPPPPPPEEPAPPPVPVEVPIFANPPPVLVPTVPSIDKPLISCVPTANLEPRPMDDFMITPAPRDLEHKAKKCKNCDTMEFRLQFNKDKAENMRQSTVELKNKVARLSRKSQTLYTVLLSLMKPQVSKRQEGLNGLSMSSLLSIVGDSEKNILSNLLLKDASEQSLVSDTRDPCS